MSIIDQQPNIPGGVGVLMDDRGFSQPKGTNPLSNQLASFLVSRDRVLIKQEVDMLEALCGFQKKKIFKFLDSQEQLMFVGREESECCSRNCWKHMRPFSMEIQDNHGNTLLNLERPLKCDNCCWPCCPQLLEIMDHNGTMMGTVEQEWAFFNNKFSIKNEAGEVVLRILGQICPCSCCGSDVVFKILTPESEGDQQVGLITKKWAGCGKEMFTEAENFDVEFPNSADVKVKSLVLGATILINFMYFERKGGE